MCGTDLWLAQGALSFRPFPLVLGHEGAGEVVAVGEGVTKRKVGDRVGVFMMRKADGVCDFCHEEHTNSFVTAANCANPKLTGVTVDGAFSEYIAVDVGGTVLLPDGVPYEGAAPILCSGYTVWAAIRRAAPKPRARIGVVGIGALGHLAIQYAKAAGLHVVAITKSTDKHDLVRELGAHDVVTDGAELKAAGEVDVLLHTSSSHELVLDAIQGVKPRGKIILCGIGFDEMNLPALGLTSNSLQVIGSAHNGIEYLVEALEFLARGEVKPMIEVFPKEQVGEAFDKVVSGKTRFKAVVTF
ncbi:alcohol dehydrogenase catalytic domain-containing protein [Desertimonas flava]|uniref:alcohol dehydrogenase catalytic domain-containing protein n=1 Tax=Desertimonas flava TaxID=2064846 RepID=UPI000E356396